MKTEIHRLRCSPPGTIHELRVLRFGTPGARPKATIQAALHADETPALLVAQALRDLLQQLEDSGALLGEVVLVPAANPVGLGQHLLGRHEGRFDLRDGINFNRGHANLADRAQLLLQGRLGSDPQANVMLVRQALLDTTQSLQSQTLAEDLKHTLLLLAIDSDVVLDLHCDSQAVVHLYALPQHEPLAVELGALLGARAVLLASDSGDGPFDEACSRPWVQLQERFAAHPIPAACFASTVELRGECDTDLAQAQADASALVAFLRRQGLVAGEPGALPAAQCRPTPLAASEPVTAPHAGAVVFHARPGDHLSAGDAIATLVEIDTGNHTVLRVQSDGVMYACISTRWAAAGQRLAKVAGSTLMRTGKLLSA
jgi:predicted deacylase